MTLKTSSLQKGLVLHLPLDKESLQSATVFADKTPYENMGTSANPIVFVPDRMGQADRAMSFNGTSDYIDCGNDVSLSLSFGTGDFTVSYWLNSLYTGPQGIMFSKYDGGNIGWYIDINPPNVRFKVGGGTNQLINSVDVNIPDGNWHHVICLKTASNLSIYVDGVFNSVGGYNNENTNSSANLLVGVWDIYPISGTIADVRIYNRALSPEEVTALYEQYRPKVVTSSLQKGLVLHLPLDQQSYNPATKRLTDKTPYENAGTSANAVSFVPDRMGQADRAISFNGIDDCVDCGNDESLIFGTGDFSLSAWIYLMGNSGETYPAIIGKGDVAEGEWMLRIMPCGINDIIELYATARIASTREMPLLNVWKHCVFVRNGDDGYMYVDTIQEGHSSGIAAKNFTTTKTVRIGNADGAANRFFTGSIDEVRIYNRAISPEEVTALYEQYRPKLLV